MKAWPALVLALASGLAWGQVKVEGAWVRPTVPGQQAGGGFMTLTSAGGDRLLGGSTPVAERFELHTMSMNGDVMVMRQVEGIDLPAGRKVELKPGGLHVMFVGLRQALAAGTTVPLTLRFQKAGELKVDVQVTARPPAGADAHKH
jgi:copper(I)-binding protein